MTLYELNNEYLKALDSVEVTEDGECIGFENVEAIAVQIEEKAENIALYIKNEEALIGALSNEIKALQERLKPRKDKVDSLKRYLADSLIAVGKSKVETAKCKIVFRKSVSVQVADVDALPEEYKRITVKMEADKTALKKALQDGEIIDGVELIENNNIQIK